MRHPSAPMRSALSLLLVLFVVSALPARAQTGGPAGSLVREDGTLDLSAAPAGPLDLSGMRVRMGADGQLRATAEGEYTAISAVPGGLPLGESSVSAVAVGPDGTVYVGGNFTFGGGVTLNRVARRVGTSWQPLGSGIGGGTGNVYALAVGPDGSLYAGGNFETAGGAPARRVARWTGSAWEPLGSGVGGVPSVNTDVRTLAVGPDGSLYAGGNFETAGGAPARNVARWTGAAWEPLGTGTNSSVYALAAAPDGRVYAGGYFGTAGGVTVNRVARWTGSAWQALGAGVNDSPNGGSVSALAVGPDGSLYAGGHFTTAGGAPAHNIARWTGSVWHPLGDGITDDGDGYAIVCALVVEPDGSVYAGGDFTTAGGVPALRIARWVGSTWQPLDRGVNRDPLALADAPGAGVYAGGGFGRVGGLSSKNVAFWDGAAWHSMGSQVNAAVYELVAAPDGSVLVGGSFTTAGDAAANSVARWTGSAWQEFGAGLNPSVLAVAVGPDGTIYASSQIWVRRWDGARWRELSGLNGGTVNDLVVASDGTLYAATTSAGVRRWSGTTWQTLGSGMGGAVTTLALGPDGALYAGGSFTTAGGLPASRVARWNGSAWQALGDGLNNSVRALAVAPDGSLYAGGQFTGSGSMEVSRVARWTGSAWQPLGAGVNNSVYALAAAPDGSVYVGGDFTTAGGAPASHLARWTGAAWEPLGTGASGPVHALALDGQGDLVIGGSFWSAGGVASPYVVHYNTPAPPAPSVFTFLRPEAGDAYRVGNWLKAVWDTAEPGPATVVLTLRKSGADVVEIYRGPNLTPPDFGAARYRIPAGTPPGDDYSLRLEDASNPATFALSDAFAITDPSIAFALTHPVGGEVYAAGGAVSVAWTSPTNAGSVVLTVEDKVSGEVVASVTTPDDGAELIMLPAEAGRYVVRVTSTEDPALTSRSGTVTLRVIHVVSPAEGATYNEGDPLTVRWEAPTLGSATVRIEIKRPGQPTRVLTPATANDGEYGTMVPTDLAPGSNYYVLVSATVGGTTHSGKSGQFTIHGTARPEGPPALAHLVLPPLAFGTREATLTVAGLADGAEVGAYWAGRLVGAGVARGGAATFDVRGALVVAALVDDGRPTADDVVDVPDGAPLVLRVVEGGVARELDSGATFADGAEIAVASGGAVAVPSGVAPAVGVYPNPASSRATVRFTAGAGPASVTVYDLLGRRVATAFEDEVAAGEHEVDVATGALPAGVYVVRVSAGGAAVTVRLTVVR